MGAAGRWEGGKIGSGLRCVMQWHDDGCLKPRMGNGKVWAVSGSGAVGVGDGPCVQLKLVAANCGC